MEVKISAVLFIDPCNEDGDLRLVGNFEGRVEICFEENWGTVCDDSWDTRDAAVVCRQLGFNSSGALAFSEASFGSGTGPIFFDDIDCTGSEETLISCPHQDTQGVNCFHDSDAGVRCQVLDEINNGENNYLCKVEGSFPLRPSHLYSPFSGIGVTTNIFRGRSIPQPTVFKS